MTEVQKTSFQMLVRPLKPKREKCLEYQIKEETQENLMVPRATLLGVFTCRFGGLKICTCKMLVKPLRCSCQNMLIASTVIP
jgi:hypothetical protein